MKKSTFSTVHNCLEPLLKNGLEKEVFSGAAVGVYSNLEKREKRVFLCCGKTKKEGQAEPIKETTFFDLASLTKPLCTVLSILHLLHVKKIKIDTTIEECIGDKSNPFLKEIEITHLLAHSSGLRAYAPYYKNFEAVQKKGNKKRLLDIIHNEKAERLPGVQSVYSDLGYILLGEAIESITGCGLDEFFLSAITKPLGLEQQLLFRPVDEYKKKEKREIAATQSCPWRKRVLQGEVDDEHSWLMNGVAGHAGLFGTVHGVMDMCIHILEQWKERNENFLFSSALLRTALSRHHVNQTWCLGFDTPSTTDSSSGSMFSPQSVGHLGFTGTSFWIDPEKEVIIVLLTNRVHMDRNNEKIKKFRPLLHDTVMKFLVPGGVQ